MPNEATITGAGGRENSRRQTDFEKQMLPHLDALYRSALSMTKNPGDAEGFGAGNVRPRLSIFRPISRGTNARAWLFRIMTNLYINSYRKKRGNLIEYPMTKWRTFTSINRLSDAQTSGTAASRKR